MKKMPTVRLILFTMFMMLMGALPAIAQCPDLIEANCDGGTAWFGLRHDGAQVGQGQSFTMECNAEVLGAEFRFVVTGNPNGGIPSMVAGDDIHVILMDADENVLTSATTALPADIYDDWLAFDFPPGMVVPAGQYRVLAYTEVSRNCAFRFGYGEGADCYDGGTRWASLGGLEGPWFDMGPGDVPFRVHLNDGQVGAELRSWDSVKGLYR